MKIFKYGVFYISGLLALLIVYANIFYYTQRYNELIIIEDLLSGKQVKCGDTLYQLDNEHFLYMFYDSTGRNEKSMTIMRNQSKNIASGNPLYRCSSINNSEYTDIKISIIY